MSEYKIHVSSTDLSIAFDAEADRAKSEGFTGVEKRQRHTALHIRNAVEHMQKICPVGFRVETKIVVHHVPDVNPVLMDQYRSN